MKSINATLSALQKVPFGRGFATAALTDNGRLHPTQTVSNASAGTIVSAVECGTFYLRLRYNPAASGSLDYQKITDPTVSSQWTTWVIGLVATNVYTYKTVSIFWTGAYCKVR